MTTIDNTQEIEEAFLSEYLKHKRGEAPEAMRVLLKPSDIGALVRVGASGRSCTNETVFCGNSPERTNSSTSC